MKKTYRWERLDHSQVVSPTPVFIGCVILTPDNQAQGSITLYDGESDTDPELVTIKSGSGITKVVRFQPCLETQRGLYYKNIVSAEETLIQYQHESE